jgi:hypothetical protein
MSRKARTICFLICLACSTGTIVSQASAHQASKEPTFFSPDYVENDPFKHALPPTDDVLNALLKTPQALQAADALAKLDREELRRTFSVVKVHLSDSSEDDEVVLGSVPMSGADNDWFWIIRRLPDHAQVVLFANGLSLELLNSKTVDYKNIRTSWGAASGISITCIYHYDGTRYRLVHKYTKTASLAP